MRHLFLLSSRVACETPLKLGVRRRNAGHDQLGRRLLLGLCFVVSMFVASAAPLRAAQPEPAAVTTAEGAHHEEEGTAGGPLATIARLVNFVILIGTLVYLLRSPFAQYLLDRSTQIRSDLVNAAAMKREAAAQIEEIDRKMRALPAELETLRVLGAQEIVAEEQRILAAAAAERDRLLEQARREIDLQVKIAERDLVSHAADLAVGVATERIKSNITDDDRKKLVDRYVQQLKG
jgi:F-type H+-transporting ATPase subunit b